MPVNPFPDGTKLMDRMHKLAVFFSYSTRLQELHKFANVVDIALIRLKPDMSTTRVSARMFMLESIVRLHKALVLYSVTYKVDWAITVDDLETCTEFLAILKCSGKVATLSQTETQYTSALSLPLREHMMDEFRSETLQVVDLTNVTANPKMPCISKQVADMTPTGKEALRRATLEGERR